MEKFSYCQLCLEVCNWVLHMSLLFILVDKSHLNWLACIGVNTHVSTNKNSICASHIALCSMHLTLFVYALIIYVGIISGDSDKHGSAVVMLCIW